MHLYYLEFSRETEYLYHIYIYILYDIYLHYIYNIDSINNKELAYMITEAEKSQDLHCQAGDPGEIMI